MVAELADILVYACLAMIVICLIFPMAFPSRETFRALRSVTRIRLRTLLLVFSAIQIVLAIATWQLQMGTPVRTTFLSLGVGSFTAWSVWHCLADASGTTPSRKWKAIIRPRRIVDPAESARETDPSTPDKDSGVDDQPHRPDSHGCVRLH